MPEQFVNPSPNLLAKNLLFFDFPCETPGENVAQLGASTYSANGTYGNVNLKAPGIEQLYGQLGTPPKDQGHPFMKEYDSTLGTLTDTEQEDPTISRGGTAVFHDQIVDIDRGILIDHTGRLSGTFIEAFAGKPYFSEVKVSAVAQAPAAGASVQLETFRKWLEPRPNHPNEWFWRDETARNELLFTGHVRIPNPADAGFEAETVYKLVYQWKFWRYTGPLPYPKDKDLPEGPENRQRLGISGYDEAISFEVISKTYDL